MWLLRKRALIQSLGKKFPYTNDMDILEDSQHKLIFLCDDTQPGHIHMNKVTNAKVVSRGFTQDGFDYRITKHNGRAVPFMGKGEHHLKVKGKLVAIESRRIPALDNHYRNGVEFARVRTHIIVTDRDHQIMSIGSEEFLKRLPPGMIRTVPELGIRHYTSNPIAGLVSAYMYVALKAHWDEDDHNLLRNPVPTYPKQELIWLPKYYRYPIERNRCPPIPK
jgi:hypothetical protein